MLKKYFFRDGQWDAVQADSDILLQPGAWFRSEQYICYVL